MSTTLSMSISHQNSAITLSFLSADGSTKPSTSEVVAQSFFAKCSSLISSAITSLSAKCISVGLGPESTTKPIIQKLEDQLLSTGYSIDAVSSGGFIAAYVIDSLFKQPAIKGKPDQTVSISDFISNIQSTFMENINKVIAHQNDIHGG